MIKSTLFLSLAVLLVVSMMLGGCGGGGEDLSSITPPDQDTPPASGVTMLPSYHDGTWKPAVFNIPANAFDGPAGEWDIDVAHASVPPWNPNTGTGLIVGTRAGINYTVVVYRIVGTSEILVERVAKTYNLDVGRYHGVASLSGDQVGECWIDVSDDFVR